MRNVLFISIIIYYNYKYYSTHPGTWLSYLMSLLILRLLGAIRDRINVGSTTVAQRDLTKNLMLECPLVSPLNYPTDVVS